MCHRINCNELLRVHWSYKLTICRHWKSNWFVHLPQQISRQFTRMLRGRGTASIVRHQEPICCHRLLKESVRMLKRREWFENSNVPSFCRSFHDQIVRTNGEWSRFGVYKFHLLRLQHSFVLYPMRFFAVPLRLVCRGASMHSWHSGKLSEWHFGDRC